METLLLMAVLAQASPVSVAAPPLQSVGVDANLLTDHVAQQLTLQGLRVITPSQIASLLGQERQKELMGCKDDGNSCLAELAGAVGTDALVSGSVGRVGEEFVINLGILSARTGSTLSTLSAK